MPDDQHEAASIVAGTTASNAAPPDGKASPANVESKVVRRWLSWRRLRLWGKTAFAVTTTISTILIVVWFVYLLSEATLRRHTLDLAVISVPKRMADDGFTSQVVAQRLREAINTVLDQARTKMAKTSADVPQDMSTVTIPKVGISVESMAASIRDLLPEGWQHEVSGEFTVSGEQLRLQLRLNGRSIFPEYIFSIGNRRRRRREID